MRAWAHAHDHRGSRRPRVRRRRRRARRAALAPRLAADGGDPPARPGGGRHPRTRRRVRSRVPRTRARRASRGGPWPTSPRGSAPCSRRWAWHPSSPSGRRAADRTRSRARPRCRTRPPRRDVRVSRAVRRNEEWFAGMQAPQALRAAVEGEEARRRFAEIDEFDPDSFVDGRLRGAARAVGVARRRRRGVGRVRRTTGSSTTTWRSRGRGGSGSRDVTASVLLVQGERDRVIPPQHARLARGGAPERDAAAAPRRRARVGAAAHLASALDEPRDGTA